jgi:putative protein kinase ArgK-like GTPase of G3E family
MEVADLVVVNKADGALLPAALRTQSSYRQVLATPAPPQHWQRQVYCFFKPQRKPQKHQEMKYQLQQSSYRRTLA